MWFYTQWRMAIGLGLMMLMGGLTGEGKRERGEGE